ncbi:pyridoxamine 5'-phosphate oxidase family protein [Sulfitobacter sp. D35]|uniref:pyridoxamine 5'-phosphate oxidase family protein n=1 Tax=Sulfitobacter sp. D35 TaxID=3083252 RepID=UPI00296EF26D|nr:pyridoxamine 5'-phosphate oxidase family protein [Sulfitobacter sp. D35]MDW4497196.1 pyridoxamine 5'-phosphate oxidase family protein [Sulfitobacter sp. D35]
MSHAWHDIAFTESVKTLQESNGSRSSYARFEDGPLRGDRIGAEAAAFIAARDSFYMASVGETGWPYIQHRGGPTGFVRVLDDKSIGFADFAGNKQYVSLGNLQRDDRVSLFFMDYPNRARLKVFGRASVIDPADAETLARLAVHDYPAKVERGLRVDVAALDWNCPQHITPRYAKADGLPE